ncbi:MAG: hypothetical protein CSA68_02805 [Rhodobacterales bacterium]|nr:MAG: hypothetical protein CSA68_02805 [Rhodobacterales bacterium]
MNTDISIIYHLGAPFTDDDQLTWSLRQDNQLMIDNGVLIRRPKEYRIAIKALLDKLRGTAPSVADQEKLLQSIIRKQDVRRIIMSDPTFMGSPVWMFFGGDFYPNAGKNTAAIRNLFPQNPCEFYLGISNPASFVPTAFKDQTKRRYEQFVEGVDLSKLRWSEVIHSIQRANPGCPVTVWCNEDTPIIWPKVLRSFAGLGPDVRLKGELDILRGLMSDDNVELLIKYLAERPDLSEKQRQQIRMIFLERFALEEAVEDEIDLPGWTEQLVDHLTDIYEDDVAHIQQMPGVTLISL